MWRKHAQKPYSTHIRVIPQRQSKNNQNGASVVSNTVPLYTTQHHHIYHIPSLTYMKKLLSYCRDFVNICTFATVDAVLFLLLFFLLKFSPCDTIVIATTHNQNCH
eukprot:GDKI01038055.1.p1 GENE.GDKI01038055.1~~GDKI01038055.1.p1  ORF type:complete len:106 (+),score=5.82 GDKI01038055.1:60-377(+)